MAVLGLHCCAWALSSCGRRWLLSTCRAQASHCMVFSCCRESTLGVRASGIVVHGLRLLWCTGSVALWHVGSSWTRDGTSFPCIAKRIPNHWTTMEAQLLSLFLVNWKKKTTWRRASLVAQWWRTFLPVQETRVRFLIWEDRTLHGVTKPVCPNYSAWVLEPRSCK